MKIYLLNMIKVGTGTRVVMALVHELSVPYILNGRLTCTSNLLCPWSHLIIFLGACYCYLLLLECLCVTKFNHSAESTHCGWPFQAAYKDRKYMLCELIDTQIVG